MARRREWIVEARDTRIPDTWTQQGGKRASLDTCRAYALRELRETREQGLRLEYRAVGPAGPVGGWDFWGEVLL